MSKERSPSPNSLERKKKVLEGMVIARIGGDIRGVTEANPATPIGFGIYAKGYQRFIEGMQERFPEKERELVELYNLGVSFRTDDRDEFVQRVAVSVSDFIASFISFEEMERLDREGKTMLNRLVEYKIKYDVVELHVPATFLENSSELLSLFTKALKNLADKCKHDPAFEGIRKILAKSWIILESHKTLEKRFGFTIVSLDPDKNEGSAEISKEKLIELYGSS